MRENRNNQFRPEQLVLYKQLRVLNANSEILMEYSVTYTNEQDQKRTAIGDIVDITVPNGVMKFEILEINR